jgi:small-conductance mechanosensitive channel
LFYNPLAHSIFVKYLVFPIEGSNENVLVILYLSLSYTGLVTAFAARHVLGNVFSGLFLPFSIGDTIKVR